VHFPKEIEKKPVKKRKRGQSQPEGRLTTWKSIEKTRHIQSKRGGITDETWGGVKIQSSDKVNKKIE